MASPEAVSGLDVRRLTREADLPPSAAILISSPRRGGLRRPDRGEPGGRVPAQDQGCPLAPSVTFSGGPGRDGCWSGQRGLEEGEQGNAVFVGFAIVARRPNSRSLSPR